MHIRSFEYIHVYTCICMYYIGDTALFLYEWIHKIQELRFFGVSQYKLELKFGFNLIWYRGIWVSGFGGFRGCGILSGNCHSALGFLKTKKKSRVKTKKKSLLPKKLGNLRSLLIVATPRCTHSCTHMNVYVLHRGRQQRHTFIMMQLECVGIYIYTYVFMYVYMYICTYMYICVFVSVSIYIKYTIHKCIHIYIYIYVYTYKFMNMYIYIHIMCVYIYVYTHII